MQKTFYVNCPHCKTFMEVDSATGKIIRSFAAQDKSENEDRLLSALNKIKESDSEREKKFEASKKEAKDKKSKLSELFDKERKRVQEEGDIKPDIRPFDLD